MNKISPGSSSFGSRNTENSRQFAVAPLDHLICFRKRETLDTWSRGSLATHCFAGSVLVPSQRIFFTKILWKSSCFFVCDPGSQGTWLRSTMTPFDTITAGMLSTDLSPVTGVFLRSRSLFASFHHCIVLDGWIVFRKKDLKLWKTTEAWSCPTCPRQCLSTSMQPYQASHAIFWFKMTDDWLREMTMPMNGDIHWYTAFGCIWCDFNTVYLVHFSAKTWWRRKQKRWSQHVRSEPSNVCQQDCSYN